MLEAQDVVGGNTVTEELTLPGFLHDSCSSAHVLDPVEPADARRRARPAVDIRAEVRVHRPGGRAAAARRRRVTVHRDLDSTVEEVARFSRADADELRAMIRKWDGGLVPRTPGSAPATRRSTTRRPSSTTTCGRARRGRWCTQRFEHPVVRDLLIWLGFATIQDPRRPGTGALPSAITSGRIRFGWATPVGGSGALPAALVRHLVDHGSSVVASSPVARIDTSTGRASAVELANGRRIGARRAVVSSAHLATVPGMLTSEPTPDLVEARDTWQPGLSLFAVHAALRSDITFPTANGPVLSTAGGLGTAAGCAPSCEAFERGEPDARDPWLLLVASDRRRPRPRPRRRRHVQDPHHRPAHPRRRPALGRRGAGLEHGQALMDLVHHRTGLPRDDVLQMIVETPTSLAARSPSNIGGSCHGGHFVRPDGSVSRAGPNSRPRSPASTSPAVPPTPAAASAAAPAATPAAKYWPA